MRRVRSMLHAGHGFASALLHVLVRLFLYEASNGLSIPILYRKSCCEQKFHAWHRQSIQATKYVPLSDFLVREIYQTDLPKLCPFTFRMCRSSTQITRQTMFVWRNIDTRLCNHCCSGKAVGITHSECVLAVLVIQHAMRMNHIVVCGLPPPLQYFSTFSHKRHDFRGGGGGNYRTQNVCFDFLCIFCLKTFLVIWRPERDMIKNV